MNGELVYNNSDVGLMRNFGNFKLSNEEVLLFEGANLGSGGIPGETFFLILKPNKEPEIVQALIDPLSNPIKKAWRDRNVIYVDFEVGDYGQIKPPLKLVLDKVIIDKATSATYSNFGPKLKDEDCSSLYRITTEDCELEPSTSQINCADVVREAGSGGSLADMGTFRFLSALPGFNRSQFEASCLAMCEGKEIAYEKFSGDACILE